MRILIYGAGAVGSIIAGKLFEAGTNVTLLARNERYKQLSENGLQLENILTYEKNIYRVKIIDVLESEDQYDYIIVCAKYQQVDSILPSLKKNNSTTIVFAVNTPDGYDNWAKSVGFERVMLGFPALAGELTQDKVRYFVSSGVQRLFQSTTFAELNGSTNSKRLKALIRLFKRAGFAPVITKDMDAWQKTHIAVIVGISNAINNFNGNNYALANSKESLQKLVLETRKMIRLLQKNKIAIVPSRLKFYYLPMPILTSIFKSSLGSKIGEYGMAKYAVNGKEEIRQLELAFYQQMK